MNVVILTLIIFLFIILKKSISPFKFHWYLFHFLSGTLPSLIIQFRLIKFIANSFAIKANPFQKSNF